MRKALEAVLAFYYSGPWDTEQRLKWFNLTGQDEATTRTLCDTARIALGLLPSCFGDWTGKSSDIIPADFPLSHDQRRALERVRQAQPDFFCFTCGTDGPPLSCPNCGEKSGKLAALKYLHGVIQSKRTSLNRPPAYTAACEEFEITCLAAIERLQADEQMEATAECQD